MLTIHLLFLNHSLPHQYPCITSTANRTKSLHLLLLRNPPITKILKNKFKRRWIVALKWLPKTVTITIAIFLITILLIRTLTLPVHPRLVQITFQLSPWIPLLKFKDLALLHLLTRANCKCLTNKRITLLSWWLTLLTL